MLTKLSTTSKYHTRELTFQVEGDSTPTATVPAPYMPSSTPHRAECERFLLRSPRASKLVLSCLSLYPPLFLSRLLAVVAARRTRCHCTSRPSELVVTAHLNLPIRIACSFLSRGAVPGP